MPFDQWPLDDGSQDRVLAISAAHEIRDDADRERFFTEARRVLRPQGRVVVIEQLRDLRNFSCFGFAAFHFLSDSCWRRSFRAAGLVLDEEFRLSFWMKAYVLKAEESSHLAAKNAGDGK